MLRLIVLLVSLGARAIRAMCRRRADLVLENLALQQQVAVLNKQLLDNHKDGIAAMDLFTVPTASRAP